MGPSAYSIWSHSLFMLMLAVAQPQYAAQLMGFLVGGIQSALRPRPFSKLTILLLLWLNNVCPVLIIHNAKIPLSIVGLCDLSAGALNVYTQLQIDQKALQCWMIFYNCEWSQCCLSYWQHAQWVSIPSSGRDLSHTFPHQDLCTTVLPLAGLTALSILSPWNMLLMEQQETASQPIWRHCYACKTYTPCVIYFPRLFKFRSNHEWIT